MNVFNEALIVNAVMNTTIDSPAVPIFNTYGYAVQAVFSGVPTGTLKLQASADPAVYAKTGTFTPANWTDIANSSVPVSAAGVFIWNFNGAFYNYVRLVYTDASGGTSTAVLNVNINCKG